MFENVAGDQPGAPDLQEALVRRAGEISAATCRWLIDLVAFDASEGWSTWECKSAAHWLSWQCGFDLSTAWEYLRVARALPTLPVITEAFSRGELCYAQVRFLVRIATPGTEESLCDIARCSTGPQLQRLVGAYRRVLEIQANQKANEVHASRGLRYHFDNDGFFVIEGRLSAEDGKVIEAALDAAAAELHGEASRSDLADISADSPPGRAHYPQAANRADALVALAESALAHGLASRSGGDRTQVIVHVDAATLSGSDQAPGGHCELEDGPALAPETARRLSCDAAIIVLVEDDEGQPLSVGRKTRKITPAIRRALRARDAGCRFPGCSQTRFVEGHHIEHWAAGGETSLVNLVELCWYHHRLVHEGGYRIEKGSSGAFRFFRRDGSLVDPVPPKRGPHDGDLRVEIAPNLALTKWTGERMDCHYVLACLLPNDSRIRGST